MGRRRQRGRQRSSAGGSAHAAAAAPQSVRATAGQRDHGLRRRIAGGSLCPQHPSWRAGARAATLDGIEADGLPSPTDFSMAIHHALLGMLSIHAGNRLGHTALSAGWDSFGTDCSKRRPASAERPDEPVILVHADDKLPQALRCLPRGRRRGIAAGRGDRACGRPGGTLRRRSYDQPASATVESPPTACMATDFLQFLLSDAPCVHAVGRRTQWIWRRVA